MLRRTSRNNVLAGLFLLVSLALGIAVFFVLSSAWERLTVRTNRYIVAFTLADGAEGLDKDAFVKVGGEKVGAVSAWSFRKDERTGHIIGVDVEIQVQSEIALYENAIAYLNLPLLGSSTTTRTLSTGSESESSSASEWVVTHTGAVAAICSSSQPTRTTSPGCRCSSGSSMSKTLLLR